MSALPRGCCYSQQSEPEPVSRNALGRSQRSGTLIDSRRFVDRRGMARCGTQVPYRENPRPRTTPTCRPGTRQLKNW
jgi:hypothetical protein